MWVKEFDNLTVYCPFKDFRYHGKDNRIRYKFFNLEHLLLYINNIQMQLNINTQKLQSFLIIRKKQQKTTTWNVRVQHNVNVVLYRSRQKFFQYDHVSQTRVQIQTWISNIMFWNLFNMIVSDRTACERYSLSKEHIATITPRV
jgi:hypothetical protein